VVLNDYYEHIVSALQQASHDCVPKIPHGSLKTFWNNELDRLKDKSIDMQKLWRTCGSPHAGVNNIARIIAKLDYEQAIKQAAVKFELTNADGINDQLANKDMNSFLNCWN